MSVHLLLLAFPTHTARDWTLMLHTCCTSDIGADTSLSMPSCQATPFNSTGTMPRRALLKACSGVNLWLKPWSQANLVPREHQPNAARHFLRRTQMIPCSKGIATSTGWQRPSTCSERRSHVPAHQKVLHCMLASVISRLCSHDLIAPTQIVCAVQLGCHSCSHPPRPRTALMRQPLPAS